MNFNYIKKAVCCLFTLCLLSPSYTSANPLTKDQILHPKKLLFMRSTDKNRTLLFSDSPEYIDKDGILYQDTVNGKGRLFYYHLPSVNSEKKIVVFLRNKSNKKVKFKIERFGSGGPSRDYFQVGKDTAMSYYSNKKTGERILLPHDLVILNPRDLNRMMKYDELVENMIDFTTTGPVEISVVVMPFAANAKEFLKTAQVLPKDKHALRGTFSSGDRILENVIPYNPSKESSAYFYLADNKIDLYQKGTDATDNSTALNYGNYGVNYTIKIKTKGKGFTNVYLQPLGGAYAGAVKVLEKKGQSRVVPIPSDKKLFGADEKPEYAYIGTFKNKDGIKFEFNPPGASFLPVRVILIPDEL